jgi:hypothetical protein
MFNGMGKAVYCEERARLTEEWIRAAQEHANALTNFNRSIDMHSVRLRDEVADIAALRAKLEDALRDLDSHREQHH